MNKAKNISFANLMVLPAFSLLFLTIFTVIGCEKKPGVTAPPASTSQAPSSASLPEVKGTVIAKINNYPITLEDLNAEINAYNTAIGTENSNEKINSREKKISYLKEGMIRKILLYQAAISRGLDKKEEVRKALENFKQSLLVAELVREETEKIEPTQAEIEDYYNQNKEEFREQEERRIREIVVATEDQAKEVAIEILKGTDFAALAQDRSIAKSAKNKGDLGYIAKGTASPQFDEIAFSPTLEIGKASSYFKGPDGFYILKLEDKRGGKIKPLDEFRDNLKQGLTVFKQQQKLEELINKLSQESKTEIYEGLID